MIRIRKHGTVIASFATPQEIVIDHANDDIRVGDGTDLMGPLSNVGGTLCFPVDIKQVAAGTLATSTKQSDGSQKTQVVDAGGVVAEIDDVGGEKALKVAVISTVGGGAAPAHTDDAAFTPATDQVTMCGAFYDDTGTDSVDEGDGGALRMTADRLLKIQIAGILAGLAIPVTDNAGSLTIDNANIDVALSTLATAAKQDTMITALQLIDNPVFVDDAAFTAATSSVMVVGGQYQSTPNALDDGDAGSILLDANHAVQAVLRAGTAAIGKLAANSGVDIGDVDVTSCALPTGASTLAEQQTQTTALQLIDDAIWADDAAFTTGTSKGIPAMGNYKSTVDAVDDGDVGVLHMTARRALHASLRYESTGNQIIGQQAMADSFPVAIASNQSTLNTAPVGGAAHDAPRSGNPLPMAGSARLTTLPTAVSTAADTADIITDSYGRVMTCGFFPPGAVGYQTSTITNTTETTIVTADANNCLDIICMTLTNNSDVQSTCDIRDATGGTVRLSFVIPARGGIIFMPSMPLAQTTKNNNWTVDQGTTGTATAISVYYGKRPT